MYTQYVLFSVEAYLCQTFILFFGKKNVLINYEFFVIYSRVINDAFALSLISYRKKSSNPLDMYKSFI